MEKVGYFMSPNGNLPKFQIFNSKKIHFVRGYPPKAEPECGFDGCPYKWSYIVFTIFTICILVFAGAFLLR
jgi:hypothetical protein